MNEGIGGRDCLSAMDLKVLIVEDEPVSRTRFRAQLSAARGIEVVGTTSSGLDAVALARLLSPDAVLMDIELEGDLNGVQAGQAIKADSPDIGIVLFSVHNDEHYLNLAEQGGWSYLLKKNVPDRETLVRAIRSSSWGMVAVDPELTNGLEPRVDTPLDKLTEDQLKILELVAQGYADAVIADRLNMPDEGALERHLGDIYRQLDIPSGAEVDPKVKAVLAYLDQSRESQGH